MKKTKSRKGSASSNRTSSSAKARAKVKPGRTAAARRAPVREPAGMDMLAESIAELAAIAAELRQIADDLRDMMASDGEEGEENIVVAEIEPSE
jgi:fumarate hydratase class II